VFEIVEWLDPRGRSPFASWLAALSPVAAAKVHAAIERMRRGHWGDVKPVGGGVLERRIDWGPGLRIYFGRQGERIVVLLGGGDKRRQSADIDAAKTRWRQSEDKTRG